MRSKLTSFPLSALVVILLSLSNNSFVSSFKASSAATEEEIANGQKTMTRPAYPEHWGNPPMAQTRDLRELPGGYGKGSGTLARWITEKMAADSSASSGGAQPSVWPEKDLVGMTGEGAKRAVLDALPSLEGNVHVIPDGSMVTMDFSEDRVRIFVGDDGRVARQPERG